MAIESPYCCRGRNRTADIDRLVTFLTSITDWKRHIIVRSGFPRPFLHVPCSYSRHCLNDCHTLPTELHGSHVFQYPPRKLRSATTASIYPIRTIGLACQIIDVSFIVLLCDSNHSALLDSLHAPTQPYTTTYQPYSTHRHPTRG